MKKLPLVLAGLVLLLGACAQTYTIDRATSQKWVGGVMGAGGGTRYLVQVTKKGNKAFKVDNVWLGNREKGYLLDPYVSRDMTKNQLKDGEVPADVKMVRIGFETRWTSRMGGPRQDPSDEDDDERKDQPYDPVPDNLPGDFQKGAVIFYTANGTQKSWIVTQFDKLEPIAYP